MIESVNLYLIKTADVKDSDIDNYISFFSPYISIKVHQIIIPKFELEDGFVWRDCFAFIEKIRIDKNICSDDFVIMLTNKSNYQNWFAGFDAIHNLRNIFIQTSDWNNYIYSKDTYLIIYEIMAVVFQSLMVEKNKKNYDFVHAKPIGCLNDFCEWKPDIQFKVKTADICKDCMDELEGIVNERILKESIDVFNRVREKVITSSKYFDPPSYELNYFSPIALTKRKITTNNDPLRKTLFAIDHFDLLIKTYIYFSLAIHYEENLIREFLIDNELCKRPSLGNWVKALSRLGKKQKNETNLNKIYKLTRDILKLSEKSNIVKIRNDERGHGYIKCQDQSYRSQFGELNESLNQIEDLITSAFSPYILVKALGCSKRESNKYEITFNELTGSNMMLEEKKVLLNINPDFVDGYLYIVSRDLKVWNCLHPYLVLDNCPQCSYPRLMVRDGEFYIDIFIGHRVSVEF